jgi:hypothetical protein
MGNLPQEENLPTMYRLNWDNLNKEQINSYTCKSKEVLAKISFDHELAWCTDVNCNNPCHKNAVSSFYEEIVSSLYIAGVDLCKQCNVTFKQIPGWNELCKELHSDVREAFLAWRSGGSPRFGVLFEDMPRKRAHFKYALRQCKVDCERSVADSLANKLLIRDSKSFWS